MFTSFGRSLFSMRTEHIQLPEPGCLLQQPGGGRLLSVRRAVPEGGGDPPDRPERHPHPGALHQLLLGADGRDLLDRGLQCHLRPDLGGRRLVPYPSGLPSGLIRHDLISEDTVYYWYEGSSDYLTAPAEGGSADLAQHIPTYETVLDADPEQITGTGYDDSRGGIPCIYVEVSAPGGERVDRYWISVESGLLISSETLEGEELLYRMTAYSPIQSCPSGTTFQLPDGTVLHSI